MNALSHDLENVAGELATKLAARSRHCCLFLGAGASVGAGLPDMARLKQIVRDDLPPSDHVAFDELLTGRNLEEALTRLRRIQSVLGPGEKLGAFDEASAANLDARICSAIIGAISNPNRLDAFNRLGAWASRADYHRPLEIFTVNYDLLVEQGLEKVGASYFDGFVGALEGAFRPDLIDPAYGDLEGQLPRSFVRVWKLHGSSNWKRLPGSETIVRVGHHAPKGAAVAIYPSDSKYDDSRRVPFVVLMDRFRRALAEPETLLLVSGYSFRDQHLNEVIFESARRRPRSEFIALCFGDIPALLKEEALRTKNVVVIGAQEGIIGGQLGSWSARSDVPSVVAGNRSLLGDFEHLTAFLWQQPLPNVLVGP